MKYPISVWMGYYPEYSPTETIDLLQQAGFTHSEWSHNCTDWLFAEPFGTPTCGNCCSNAFRSK